MQGAQTGATYDDENQFEIKEFRDTLTKCIEDENKVYGQKNKPRNEDPSMFDLLSWKDDDTALWNYTKREKNTVDSNICNQLKYKINKSSSHWVTENMDQFRKFVYSPNKKAAFFDIEDPESTKRPGTSKSTTIAKEFIEQLGKSQKDKDVLLKELPSKASETLDKYSIQDLKNLKDVLKVIENRAINKGGEIIKNPIAEQIADELEHQHQRKHDTNAEEEYENDERDARGQNGQEESEEDIKVEKLDFSNVQSRLLTKKIRKAKELDPVYEKDRLDRRQERIKKLNETTRWLPNSAFKTYFGKAPFENYGRGNVNPTVGGPIYGDYLKSHNVNPHSGENKPEYKQVYEHADFAATRYPESQPEPPRKCKDEIRLSQKQVEELKRRNPLVAEKFRDSSKKIIKPDLVNALRFASEENTPETSFEAEKKSKPKNLGESLKQLSKKTRAIRQETAKQSGTDVKNRNKSEPKNKKMEKAYRATQELIKQGLKNAASPQKDVKETTQKEDSKKALVQSESKQAKTRPKTSDSQGIVKGTSKATEDHDIADEFNFARNNSKKLASPSKNERPTTASEQQAQQKGRSNDSQGVKNLMQDPASAFTEKSKDKNKRVEASPPKTSKKEVSFKPAPEYKSATKPKEAPVRQVETEEKEKSQINFGKVEELQTLIKENQKNEKLWSKITEDLGESQAIDPMTPPKNYLFSLAPKETDPRYYKNVPAVWLNRIPYAGRKHEKSEDIRGVFNYDI